MNAIGWPHPTVRLRLTLTYTALFVVTGAALLGVSYLLVQQREKGPGTAVQIICTAKGPNGLPQSTFVGAGPGTGPGTLTVNPSNCPKVVGSVYYQSFGDGQVIAGGSASGGMVGPATNAGVPIPGPTAAEFGRLTATVKASQAQTLRSFKVQSALALGLLTILSFGLSWWMAGRALRPVHRITDAARSLSERTLHARINLRGPNDELKQLADTFDSMLGRLDRAFSSQRRFVANASHELRTPLATERVLIDEALANRSASPAELRSILEHLRINSEETERLIEALLVLARSERGVDKWSSIDLAETAAAVVEQAGAEAAVAGVSVDADLHPVEVSGDPALIERLAGNLIENAVRHNLPGGSVSVTTRRDGDDAVLRVVNTGARVEPEEVSGLVEPFRRAGPDRSSSQGGGGLGLGVGLGLSIVDAIVSTHHGALALVARDGGGLEVVVRLPVVLPGGDDQRDPRDPTLERSAVTGTGAG